MIEIEASDEGRSVLDITVMSLPVVFLPVVSLLIAMTVTVLVDRWRERGLAFCSGSKPTLEHGTYSKFRTGELEGVGRRYPVFAPWLALVPYEIHVHTHAGTNPI